MMRMLSIPGDRVLHAMKQGLRRGDVFLGNLTTLRPPASGDCSAVGPQFGLTGAALLLIKQAGILALFLGEIQASRYTSCAAALARQPAQAGSRTTRHRP
ncbi:hypothetical protein [Actimicrobium antarcticum]|uniref:hypothetical protein n=1 Tax=Actimicrobium antarcticum TaxID=1051899 RepID=UPI0031D5C218